MEAISTNMFLQEELNLQNDPELKTEVQKWFSDGSYLLMKAEGFPYWLFKWVLDHKYREQSRVNEFLDLFLAFSLWDIYLNIIERNLIKS